FATLASGTSNPLVRGARPGFSYGLEGTAGIGALGIYAATEKVNFDCQSQACATSGKYSVQGITAGLRLGIPILPLIIGIKPWARAGITVGKISGIARSSAGQIDVTSKRGPGYELGAGIDIPVLQFFSLTPQGRIVRQRFDYDATNGGGSGKSTVSYYTFELAFKVRSPI
ncbi:MAG: hypothetical protein ABIS03_01355, partial [Gemmatimonadaceae bacterium]